MRRSEAWPAVDLVLVGGGHAHIQVLKSFAMASPRGVRVTLVVDTPIAVYSGMVPGFVAGQYRREELEIDVLPLARLAGARVVMSAATGIDPDDRRLILADRPPLRYDAISFDIGSTVAGLDIPGVRDHALPTRPIGTFVERIDRWLAHEDARTIAVVGGGAGGVEIAFTIRERLRARGADPDVTLIEAADEVLPGASPSLVTRVRAAAEGRGVRVLTGRPVDRVAAGFVSLAGERVPADLTVWVGGAAAHPVVSGTSLADEAGFIATRRTLQSVGHDSVFAVGDCATLVDDPWVPRAGVYAVRQGPVLAENLRRFVSGRRDLERYRPQRDFLTLLNLGDGSAIGAKWGRAVSGEWVFRLKDRIDRSFMRRFRALGADEAVAPEFEGVAAMREGMEILCGGCAAKLGQTELTRALDRLPDVPATPGVELGLAEGDDAAAYAWPGTGGARVVSSVDQFRPFTDDPFLVGRIGAVNAASDVLAKGVSPSFAQALIALPEAAGESVRGEILYQVMSGALRAFDDLGVVLVGGHTTTSDELLVGFQVEGLAPPELPLLGIDRLEPGRALILTKALGTGVLLHADMLGRVRGRWFEAGLAQMCLSNAAAARIAREHGARAATDVTGFGLAGHLGTMLRASDVAAVLRLDRLPMLPGVAGLLAAGLRSTFHEENARSSSGIAFAADAVEHPGAPLLFDPQTSGGLLFDVEPARVDATLAELRAAGYEAAAAIGSTCLFSEVRLEVRAG